MSLNKDDDMEEYLTIARARDTADKEVEKAKILAAEKSENKYARGMPNSLRVKERRRIKSIEIAAWGALIGDVKIAKECSGSTRIMVNKRSRFKLLSSLSS